MNKILSKKISIIIIILVLNNNKILINLLYQINKNKYDNNLFLIFIFNNIHKKYLCYLYIYLKKI